MLLGRLKSVARIFGDIALILAFMLAKFMVCSLAPPLFPSGTGSQSTPFGLRDNKKLTLNGACVSKSRWLRLPSMPKMNDGRYGWMVSVG